MSAMEIIFSSALVSAF